MTASICSFCNRQIPSDVSVDHHEAECQMRRLDALTAAINGNNRYRDKVLQSRRLHAELIVVIGTDPHHLRGFVSSVVCDREMEDAIIKAVARLAEMDPSKKSQEDIAADAALIAEVRALDCPVILENQ